MKQVLIFLVLSLLQLQSRAQKCVLQPPFMTLHLGRGEVNDFNTPSYFYQRLSTSCPGDGFYSYVSSTAECFGGDWITLNEDHTPGDADGNFMLVNASYESGQFFTTKIMGLKSNAIYEFGVWMLNVCKPTEKCPFPLLPDITIRLQDADSKVVMQMSTGEIQRYNEPNWEQYKRIFHTPANGSTLILTMINRNQGGCGNDFALDDITFRECIPVKEEVAATKSPAVKPGTANAGKPVAKSPIAKSKAPVSKPAVKSQQPAVKKQTEQLADPGKNPSRAEANDTSLTKKKINSFPPPPPVLTSRANPVVKKIESDPGTIRIELYDNGEIDGDTVSIYHNNKLIVSKARLSQQPISFSIKIDYDNPLHEIVMVAENLGSIPPNTSVMIVREGDIKHEVFITSSEQKNARVVFSLKKSTL
jgi:hypothetical protein